MSNPANERTLPAQRRQAKRPDHMTKAEVVEYFMDRAVPLGTCLVSVAGPGEEGRPSVGFQGKIVRLARLVLEVKIGRELGDLQALHRCHNPPCINPHHLYAGTTSDNMRDRAAMGRGMKRGEDNGAAKLDWTKVREIRALYAAGGLSQKRIGERFGVSNQIVSLIVRHKVWKEESQ